MIKQYCAALVIAAVSTSALAETATESLSEKQKLSYLLGNNTAKSMMNKDIKIDSETFMRGMQDAFANKKSLLSQAESNQVMMNFQASMRAKAQEEQDKQSAANIQAGKDFFAQYKKKDGTTTLDSGIVYRVIKKGNGIKPTVNDTVVAHYTGKLVDGQVFDSSVQRGEPATFPLKNVIKGWQEIVPMMPVGAKWEVVIPPQLAYGERGPGGLIGPNATLVFEVELIEVKAN